MRRIYITTILCLSALFVFAQTDREFWFAAPDVSSVHGSGNKNGSPIYFHVTAVYPTTVTIERPADPGFTPITFDLAQLEHRTIQLDAFMTYDQIENYPLPLATGVQQKGFKITADPGEVTEYYELDNFYNHS
jgi:hypothetical protein